MTKTEEKKDPAPSRPSGELAGEVAFQTLILFMPLGWLLLGLGGLVLTAPWWIKKEDN
jgi:hypothetical protein